MKLQPLPHMYIVCLWSFDITYIEVPKAIVPPMILEILP